MNDTRERLKTRDGTGVQVNDGLIMSGKLLGDFVRAARGDVTAAPTIEDGARAMALLERVIASAT